MKLMEQAIIEAINTIQAKHLQIVLAFDNGKVYWLRDHHKYLSLAKAPRILLGKSNVVPSSSRGNVLYVTKQL
jgi:hypothetical protein